MGHSMDSMEPTIPALTLLARGTPSIALPYQELLHVLEQEMALEQMVEDVPRSIRWMEKVALAALKFSWIMERCLFSVILRVPLFGPVRESMLGMRLER
jgi:hypothetical protein